LPASLRRSRASLRRSPALSSTGEAFEHFQREIDIRRRHGRQVFAIEVRTNTRLAEAPEAGMSIFQYDARAKGAEAYRLLADEYLLRAAEVGRRG
jgi:cellulose biosynthesis protein BcsQ